MMYISKVKTLIRCLAKNLGYDITKRPVFDQDDYKNFPKKSLIEKRFYNIGAGLFSHLYWTNIDYETDYYSNSNKKSFLNHHLMALEPLSIEDNVAELVYSSHTIEHINDDAVRNMLTESYRILKPGGGIRLTTPDAELDFQAYRRNDMKYWYWVDLYRKQGTWEKLFKLPLSQASIHQLFLHHFASQLCEIDIDDTAIKKYSDPEIIEIFQNGANVEALDFFTKQCRFNPDHPGSHMNWWTHEKAISFLREAGFSDIHISGYGQSFFPALRDITLFDNTHP